MKYLISLFIILFCQQIVGYSQNLEGVPVKEEYDWYNRDLVNSSGYRPCQIAPNEFLDNGEDKDGTLFGNHMSKILEGYISMYQTTGDKAYLYHFIAETLCMMENRHDHAGVFDEAPRWSNQMFHEGYILSGFMRGVYLIKAEEPALMNETLHSFPFITNNNFNQNFQTFGDFANWLEFQSFFSMFHFIINGYWEDEKGFKKDTDASSVPMEINMQVGFARALLFFGLLGHSDYMVKANIMEGLYKGIVNIHDPCEDKYYHAPVFRLTPENGYWWYHKGWSVPKQDCGSLWSLEYHWGADDYYGYVNFIEDISHGAIVTWFPYDAYKFNPNSSFNHEDMIRFRNTLTKNLYNNGPIYHSGVDGTSGNTYLETANTPVQVENWYKRRSGVGFINFADFDDVAGDSPTVYELVSEIYLNEFTGAYPGYAGQSNKSHAELVGKQWERECPDLELYNREVVYNQDFFAKGNLTIDGEAGPVNNSFAHPVTNEKKFTIEQNVETNISSGKRITLRNFHAKKGSKVRISNSAICDNSSMIVQNNPQEITMKNGLDKTSLNKEPLVSSIKELQKETSFSLFPNPSPGLFNLEISGVEESRANNIVYDMYGRVVYSKQQAQLREQIDLSTRQTGIYFLQVTVGNEMFTEKLVVRE
jgi:hypothetical protein